MFIAQNLTLNKFNVDLSFLKASPNYCDHYRTYTDH